MDPKRLNEELRCVRRLIRADPRVLARFDLDGSGNIDGAEWERVRQSVLRRLEAEVTANSTTTGLPERPPGKVAREVFDAERTLTIDGCDHFILEWPFDLSDRVPMVSGYGPFTILTGDRLVLGELDQLLTYREVERQLGGRTAKNEAYYSIRPVSGNPIGVRRRPTLLGEELEVCSGFGRIIAYIKPKTRFLEYAYGIEAEDGRTLRVHRQRRRKGSGGRDVERKERMGWRTRRLRRWPRPYGILDEEGRCVGRVEWDVYYPDPKDRRSGFRQWVVRLQPDRMTPALRWGVLGTLVFVLRGPFLMRGWIWEVLLPDRR